MSVCCLYNIYYRYCDCDTTTTSTYSLCVCHRRVFLSLCVFVDISFNTLDLSKTVQRTQIWGNRLHHSNSSSAVHALRRLLLSIVACLRVQGSQRVPYSPHPPCPKSTSEHSLYTSIQYLILDTCRLSIKMEHGADRYQQDQAEKARKGRSVYPQFTRTTLVRQISA